MVDKDPDTAKELIESINKSGTPSTKISLEELNNDIPEGNHSLSTLVNLAPTDRIKSIYEQLKEIGVDLDQNNILVTTAPLKKGRRERASMHKKGKKTLALLTPQEESIEAYMKMKLADAAFKQSAKDVKDEISGIITSILPELKESGIPGIQAKVNAIQKSLDPIESFIEYLYGSITFNRALRKTGRETEIKVLFSKISNIESEQVWSYSDPVVQSFAEQLDNWRISTEKLDKIGEELGTSTPLETIQEINNRIDSGSFFDIKFMGDSTVIFNPTRTKPEFEFPVINQEYYGESVTPVMSLKGYNIVEYNKKYYVSDKVVQTVEDLPDMSFQTLNGAIGAARSYISKTRLSLNNIRNLAKVKDVRTVATRSKLKAGDRFIVTDVQFDKLPELLATDEALSKSFDGFFREMKNSPYREALTELSEYNIQTLLSTPEKVETFVWLRAKYREEFKEEYKNAWSNLSPRRDAPEKIKVETEITRRALEDIKNAKEVMYQVIDKKGNNVEIEKLQLENEIPVHRMATKSFKGELVEIAQYLGKNFGIKYNIVTSSDIRRNKELNSKIPNAKIVNAFIYEGEVYINVDNATTADALHEFAHIIMGTIKRKNPELYYSLVDSVENAADYSIRLDKYSNDKRARADINEEIFVEKFSEYISDTIVDPWLKENSGKLDGLEKEYQQAIKKALQTTDDIKLASVSELNNMSLQEVMGRFGSALLERDPDMFDIGLAKSSRVTANLISKLKEDGKLTENCN